MKRSGREDSSAKRTNKENTGDKEDNTNVLFEDPFVDTYEEEDIVDEEEEKELEQRELQGEDEELERHNVFKIGKDRVEEGEQMEYDNSAYRMYHRLNVEWPCLSFDIISDNLGALRRRYPHTLYIVSGTQTETGEGNQIVVSKISSLCETRYDDDPTEFPEDDSDPIISTSTFPHNGAVNRIRCLPDRSQIVSVWSETGTVSIYNIAQQLSTVEKGVPDGLFSSIQPSLAYQFTGHRSEGYAMDWSGINKGFLATGDCVGAIHITSPVEGGWRTDDTAFRDHAASVEDLQWSPSEATVFASGSVDRSIKIWDTRNPSHRSMLSVAAHDSDVNVIHWNKQVGYLIVSGSDDGSFRIWDIRNLNAGFVGNFDYLNAPITSVEWSPHDSSVLGVSSDEQLTLWDLSLEADAADQIPGVPPQLLFVHAGQTAIKELHFHPQIPDLVVSTAQDGFNCFIPDISVGDEMEEE